MAKDSTKGTLLHKQAVQQVGSYFLDQLARRIAEHDNSKLEEPELTHLNANPDPPAGYSNGSWGEGAATGNVSQQVSNMRKFLDHHYAVNRHHPEHFENGIDGMTIVDLIEMFVDWSASTLRTSDGNIYRSIQFNKSRFKMSDQLVRIFMNTAVEIDQLLMEMKEGYLEK